MIRRSVIFFSGSSLPMAWQREKGSQVGLVQAGQEIKVTSQAGEAEQGVGGRRGREDVN